MGFGLTLGPNDSRIRRNKLTNHAWKELLAPSGVGVSIIYEYMLLVIKIV